jgi:hypothetical protein
VRTLFRRVRRAQDAKPGGRSRHSVVMFGAGVVVSPYVPLAARNRMRPSEPVPPPP